MKNDKNIRFTDHDPDALGALFAKPILVKCQNCLSMAQVSVDLSDEITDPEVSFSCVKCGQSKKRSGKTASLGGPYDVFFRFPLWLQTEFQNKTLYAYNEPHLNWLINYVSAEIRERNLSKDGGYRNRSLSSRIPKWMKESKNREGILKALFKLKKILDVKS